ncbi:MAG: RidA family protein [Gordonia sp. (in: high G+C Gram-positive bacteria)]|uniref:RidA family protein n=1 Tax=Gordonia sp. (in: high G+C Gram-positive bacteria) TaxID=84139 RepID=UPI0039E61C48
MQRTAINPTTWSQEFGFNQGELVVSPGRILFVAGQTATDANGAPQHIDDMAGQLQLAVANLEAVLTEAGMSLANVVRLNVFTTDVDALMPHYGVLGARLGEAQVSPVTTMVGVTRLAIPGQLIELEATACSK